ncbi:MAG: hypothetical protein ACYSW8_26505 [Planctomycetota bacterium]|jgi:hypothetical protein
MKSSEEIAAEKNERELENLAESRQDKFATALKDLADLDMEEIKSDDPEGAGLEAEYTTHCHDDLKSEMADAERKNPSPEEFLKRVGS